MPEVILNGPEGRIECMYSQGKESGCPVALILHPEPYQGGSMNNKVTYSLYQEFKNIWKLVRLKFTRNPEDKEVWLIKRLKIKEKIYKILYLDLVLMHPKVDKLQVEKNY